MIDLRYHPTHCFKVLQPDIKNDTSKPDGEVYGMRKSHQPIPTALEYTRHYRRKRHPPIFELPRVFRYTLAGSSHTLQKQARIYLKLSALFDFVRRSDLSDINFLPME